jgi:hypothetical protein
MRIVAFVIIVALLGLSQAQAAVPTHQYRLDGTYSDDYGGPSLEAAGGTLDSTQYTFGGNQGLSLTAALASGSVYTIELQFKFDDVNGLRKIIDFQNLNSAAVLSVQDGQLKFCGQSPAVRSFAPNTYRTVVLTRDSSDKVTGYVDGQQVFQFHDSDGATVLKCDRNAIQLFRNNEVSAEESASAVNYIRIYDVALTPTEISTLPPPTAKLPEPTMLAIWSALAGWGLIPAIRRKRAA